MKFCTRFFFSFVTLVILTALLSPKAESGVSFRITPMMTSLTIAPGDSQTNVISVTNDATPDSPPMHVKVSIQDWTLDVKGDMKMVTMGSEADTCGSWVQVDPLELNVPGGQTDTVRYTVTVPSTAQGSYHCLILFTTDPEPGTYHGMEVHINGCIGNTVYVQVGPTVRRAKISSLALTPSIVTMAVENTGSSYIRLGGVVKIADSAGNLLQQIKIPGDAILAGQNNTRIVPLTISPPLATGSYTVTALIDYGGDALLGARINATLH